MNTKPQDTLESGAQWVIKTIAPKDQQQAWMDHYRANRNAWNVGVGALGGATVAALANGAANAFGGDDRGNGGGSSWGWLAPMALGAAGMWAWNKYGSRIKNTLNRFESAGKALENFQKRGMTVKGPLGTEFTIKPNTETTPERHPNQQPPVKTPPGDTVIPKGPGRLNIPHK